MIMTSELRQHEILIFIEYHHILPIKESRNIVFEDLAYVCI